MVHGRRLAWRIVRWAALACLALAAVAAYVTQPLLTPPHWNGGAARPAGAADAQRLRRHVVTLAEALAPRDYRHVENLDRVASYIRAELEAAGAAVAEQPFEAAGATYRNVIARLGPDAGERVIVGAHYDAAGPLPGADDNASGVAGLLELARLLDGRPLGAPVHLVAYCLEEPPFFGTAQMGSAVHARALAGEGVPVRLMIGLEMIGYFSDVPGSQAFPAPWLRLFYPGTGDFIVVAGRPGEASAVRRVKRAMAAASPLPARAFVAPRWVPGLDLSDHASYWDAGYPAVMVTDTAFYRNPAYHGPADTPDTLDYGRMAQVVDGVLGAVLRLAGPPR